jgi:RNA recognition motif-containing protein
MDIVIVLKISFCQSSDALGLHGLAEMNLAAIQGAGLGIRGFHSMGDLSANVCIKMKGLPYTAYPRDIMKFFEGYRIAPNGIFMVLGLNERATGEAFVEFVSVDEAQRAMERNRRSMGTRYVELLRATKRRVFTAFPTCHLEMEQMFSRSKNFCFV